MALPGARQMSVGEMIADCGGVRANVAKGPGCVKTLVPMN